jgi:hypothetical protein
VVKIFLKKFKDFFVFYFFFCIFRSFRYIDIKNKFLKIKKYYFDAFINKKYFLVRTLENKDRKGKER